MARLTPARGDELVYLCLAGFRYDAVVRHVRPDGRVDLASDVGCVDPHELTGIEFVETCDLKPGTCAVGRRIEGETR